MLFFFITPNPIFSVSSIFDIFNVTLRPYADDFLILVFVLFVLFCFLVFCFGCLGLHLSGEVHEDAFCSFKMFIIVFLCPLCGKVDYIRSLWLTFFLKYFYMIAPLFSGMKCCWQEVGW